MHIYRRRYTELHGYTYICICIHVRREKDCVLRCQTQTIAEKISKRWKRGHMDRGQCIVDPSLVNRRFRQLAMEGGACLTHVRSTASLSFFHLSFFACEHTYFPCMQPVHLSTATARQRTSAKGTNQLCRKKTIFRARRS